MAKLSNSVADSAGELTEQQAGSSGKPLPDLAWVETLFAAPGLPHSVNEELAASVAEVVSPAVECEVMSSATPLSLPAQCLLRDAVEMKPVLLERSADDELSIDIHAVERVDAAFVQVLVALLKQREGSGKAPPTWQGASSALSEAAQVLGLTQMMQFPAA